MALPVCSVCKTNEATVTFTDFEDGTTITPCPLCFPELVEYIASMADAYAALFQVMEEGEASEVDGPDELSQAVIDAEQKSEDEAPSPKARGRSQAKLSEVPTDTEAVPDETTTEAVTASAE